MVVARRRVARDIDPLGESILPALVRRRGIVIGDAFSTGVEVFYFHPPRQRPGHAAKGSRRRHRHHAHAVERPNMTAGADLIH